jgi:hypothetical protein
MSVTESFLQRCERGLAGAVAWRNVFDLERIFQSRYRLCDNIVRRDDKVETAVPVGNLIRLASEAESRNVSIL